MRYAGTILRVLAALPLVMAWRLRADGPYVSLTAAGIWQDNVTNATSGDGVLGAFTLETSADVNWIRSVDFSTLLNTGLAATADVCTTFSGLDSFSAGPRVEVRHKLGLGPFAPALSLGFEADGTVFSDAQRSNVDGAVVARYSERFDEALQLVVDARACAYDANHEVFSGNYASLGAALNWDLDPTWRLKATGGWRDGDIVAEYAAQESPYGWVPIDSGAYYYTGPWQLVKTFSEPFIAYRARYQTWSYGAGLSPAVGRNTSLVLQFTRFSTKAYDRYVNDVVSAGVAHHF